MNDRFDLTGRSAIVTGASSGIGEHFVRTLSSAGALVVAAARRVDRLEQLAAEHPNVLACPCDVTDGAALDRLVGIAVDAHGAIDIVVNNAGLSRPRAAVEMDAVEFTAILDVNLTAALELSRRCVPHMTAGGTIINVGSILGLVSGSAIHDAAYGASKAAILHLTKHLADEWALLGIRVNALAPGWFHTEMNEALFDDERSLRWLERQTPMHRAGELEELDGPLLLLASDAGSFMTGHTLVVDGGWTIR